MSWFTDLREAQDCSSFQEARVLNHATWNPLAQLGHLGSITSPDTAVVYKEVSETAMSVGHQKPRKSHYIVCELPVKVTQQKVPLDKPNVKLGVGKLQQRITCPKACKLWA